MINRIVKMTFQPDRVDAFLKIFAEAGPKIRQFQGCESVRLIREVDGSNVLFTISLWVSEQDLEAYRHSELFKTTWAKTKVMFAAKPEAWSTTEVPL